MGPKTVEQYLIEKLEELPDAIQHILYEHGDRIAQLYVIPLPELELEWSDELSETDRGEGGYGSTGR